MLKLGGRAPKPAFEPIVYVGAVVGLIVVAVVAVVGSHLLAQRAQPTPWDAVNGKDTLLSVRFTGSSCQTSSRVDVDESPTRVVITAYEGVSRDSCGDAPVPYELAVSLQRPLGDRTIVNGACVLKPSACFHD